MMEAFSFLLERPPPCPPQPSRMNWPTPLHRAPMPHSFLLASPPGMLGLPVAATKMVVALLFYL